MHRLRVAIRRLREARWVARLRLMSPRALLHVLRSADVERLEYESRFLRKYPLAKDEWGLVFPHGMGDLYLACGFARALLDRHGGSGFVVYVKPQVAFIPALFGAVTRVVPVADFNLKKLQQYHRLERGRLFSVFPLHQFWNVIGYKGVHFIDYYCLFLGLPFGTMPLAPRRQSAEEHEAARDILRRHGLRERNTVILAPVAVSSGDVGSGFWARLAAALKSRGYDVASNSPGATPPIPGTVALDVPLASFIAVAEMAGWLISVRSGLCDIVCHATCRLTVVYPDEVHKGGPLVEGFGLRSTGLRADAQELVVSGDPDAAIQAILGVDRLQAAAR